VEARGRVLRKKAKKKQRSQNGSSQKKRQKGKMEERGGQKKKKKNLTFADGGSIGPKRRGTANPSRRRGTDVGLRTKAAFEKPKK